MGRWGSWEVDSQRGLLGPTSVPRSLLFDWRQCDRALRPPLPCQHDLPTLWRPEWAAVALTPLPAHSNGNTCHLLSSYYVPGTVLSTVTLR